ncbi:MAG: hypothetical protein C5B49_03385 [Bdellovibrio sp.]|nr:MAG: hypothetical protein C5B49_03385 [Bdellovibrio sp.]
MPDQQLKRHQRAHRWIKIQSSAEFDYQTPISNFYGGGSQKYCAGAGTESCIICAAPMEVCLTARFLFILLTGASILASSGPARAIECNRVNRTDQKRAYGVVSIPNWRELFRWFRQRPINRHGNTEVIRELSKTL